jgi:hypothetical protein
VERSRPDIRLWREHHRGGHFPMLIDESSNTYSAQQESFAGSLRREIATIFSASAIVG